MKKKLLIFHSALAPYRINFFNKLSEEFSATIVFLSDNLRNQNFNRANLLAQITFTPHYLKHKIVIMIETLISDIVHTFLKYSLI